MVIEDPDLAEALAGLIGSAKTTLELARALELTVAAAPSLLARKADPVALFNRLDEGAKAEGDETRARLYLRALVGMQPYFPGDAGGRLLALAPKLNVVSRHLLKEWRKGLSRRVKPAAKEGFSERVAKLGKLPLRPLAGEKPHPSVYYK